MTKEELYIEFEKLFEQDTINDLYAYNLLVNAIFKCLNIGEIQKLLNHLKTEGKGAYDKLDRD